MGMHFQLKPGYAGTMSLSGPPTLLVGSLMNVIVTQKHRDHRGAPGLSWGDLLGSDDSSKRSSSACYVLGKKKGTKKGKLLQNLCSGRLSVGCTPNSSCLNVGKIRLVGHSKCGSWRIKTRDA